MVMGSGGGSWLRQLRATAGECWMFTQTVTDGGADGAGTLEATAEYVWLVGGTDEQSLDTWAEGAARVGGLPEEMDSTRAELVGAYMQCYTRTEGEEMGGHNTDSGGQCQCGSRAGEEAGCREGRCCVGKVGELDKQCSGGRGQLGERPDGDLWEAVGLLLERMQGKVEVNWIRGHADKRTTRRMMNKHQRGNVRADANCTAVKRGVRSRVRLLPPTRKSWRLCYDGVEMVGILKKELREKVRT